MRRELTISDRPIDEAAWVAARRNDSTQGAVLQFAGVVRDSEGGATILGLDYSSFVAMAERQFHLLFDEMERRWPISSVRLVHRLGPIKAGETSLWVETVAGHRGEAFAATQWLIDEMKRVVPIWKKPLPISSETSGSG
ncbi:MAG TPA: molybdenum cofactor biosynthesis protein MoaE [Candidatus Limnocylindria bacterium]|nr:molybdenum cofactor biosynthesis protein MoaE [Candidatus Limnocylindria bacterium]